MRILASFLVLLSVAWPGSCQVNYGTYTTVNKDSLAADSARRAADTVGRGEAGKVKIVKRRIDYSKFVMLGIGTMAFIAVMITSAQAWNPSGRVP
jgi:hypothetical protein